MDGEYIAIGFGGRLGKGKEKGGGIVRIYSADLSSDIKLQQEVAVAKEWISDVKFSSNDRIIVVGAHDCKIYIYDVTKDDAKKEMRIKYRAVFNKHNSVINHLGALEMMMMIMMILMNMLMNVIMMVLIIIMIMIKMLMRIMMNVMMMLMNNDNPFI